MLIQIVEDDFALSNGIRLALSQPGTEFFQDREVQEAQNSFQKQVPDLIILDINLPIESGYQIHLGKESEQHAGTDSHCPGYGN